MNPEAAAASGADSFGANGSNAGKKAVHVKVCFVVQSFCLCLNNDEIEIHGGHHKCFGICHDLLVMRPSTSTKNQTQRSYRYFRERYFSTRKFYYAIRRVEKKFQLYCLHVGFYVHSTYSRIECLPFYAKFIAQFADCPLAGTQIRCHKLTIYNFWYSIIQL